MEPLFKQKGFWNGEPTATFTACIIKPKENKERPMHWYNPFAGQEMQAIEFTQDGQTCVIYNQDGTGYHKVTIGLGSPRCGHKSFDAGYEIVRYIPEHEMIKAIDHDLIKREEKAIADYQIKTNPVEFERSQSLLKSLREFQRMTPDEQVRHINENMMPKANVPAKKYPNVVSAIQLKPFGTKSISQFPMGTKIILDKKSVIKKKEHQIVYQQGACYGSVGDMCDYVTHEQLFRLAESGAIKITTK